MNFDESAPIQPTSFTSRAAFREARNRHLVALSATGMTLQEMGDLYGITREMVRQILAARRHLRRRPPSGAAAGRPSWQREADREAILAWAQANPGRTRREAAEALRHDVPAVLTRRSVARPAALFVTRAEAQRPRLLRRRHRPAAPGGCGGDGQPAVEERLRRLRRGPWWHHQRPDPAALRRQLERRLSRRRPRGQPRPPAATPVAGALPTSSCTSSTTWSPRTRPGATPTTTGGPASTPTGPSSQTVRNYLGSVGARPSASRSRNRHGCASRLSTTPPEPTNLPDPPCKESASVTTYADTVAALSVCLVRR